jgi:hypothetical protein
MKAALLTVALVLAIDVPASAGCSGKTKVFVFTAPVNAADPFGGFVPATLRDSVQDIREAIGQILNLKTTKTPADATPIIQVLSREEAQGEFRVHVHITYDGHETDMTGTATRRWHEAGETVAYQCSHCVKAHDDALKHAKP